MPTEDFEALLIMMETLFEKVYSKSLIFTEKEYNQLLGYAERIAEFGAEEQSKTFLKRITAFKNKPGMLESNHVFLNAVIEHHTQWSTSSSSSTAPCTMRPS